MVSQADGFDIIGMAFGLAEAVEHWSEQARMFFYEAMLLNRSCPACEGPLAMVDEGRCRCTTCGNEFDPTAAFQRCEVCGGPAHVSIRRYRCRQCGADVASRFLFDGLVFDPEYFRQKMAESRQRRQDLRDRVRQMLAGNRSRDLVLPGADMAGVPGLLDALNSLTADVGQRAYVPPSGWDIARYEAHIDAHLGRLPLWFDEIPPLVEDRRLDRIRRFIAIIFMAQAGTIEARQEGQNIRVMRCETNRERQDVPGDLEDADGFQGSVGGAETW